MAWLGFKKSPYLQWLEKGVDCGDPHITSHCSEKGLERHTTVFWSQVLFDSVFFFFRNNMRRRELCSAGRSTFPKQKSLWGWKEWFHFSQVERQLLFCYSPWASSTALEKRRATGISQKKTTINCHWDGALFLQNSIPALPVQGSSRNILRKRWRNKNGAGKFNWCQEAAGEGPNSVARSTVFEMPVPVFS